MKILTSSLIVVLLLLMGAIASGLSYVHTKTFVNTTPCEPNTSQEVSLFCGVCFKLPCPYLSYVNVEKRGFPYQFYESTFGKMEGFEGEDPSWHSKKFSLGNFLKNNAFWSAIILPFGLLAVYVIRKYK